MPTVPAKDPENPNRALTIDGKKFLWDGRFFETQDDALREAENYKNDSFEVRMVERDGAFLVYTRRVVKEVAVIAP